tara:strand:+ start:4828 stop:5685 length:858 start_codon:yes stop_codon:yes gene_type:complete
MIKIFNYFFQSIIIYILFIIGRILGLNVGRKVFALIFSFLGPLFKSKKILNNNLNHFSKYVSELNKKTIISNMWRNYGMTLIEYVYLNYFKKESSHITLEDEANLKEIIEKNKPVIFVSGHFSNFELMSMEITKKNIPLATIYRPLNNIFLNPFMEYLRKEYVCQNQIKKGINGVREAIEYINKNHCIALMIDQRVSEGSLINFFGKPALTTTLPAQLSIKYGLDIIPVFIERVDEKKFKIEFKKRINPENFKGKIDLTEKLNKVLEGMIIKNPNQWIWTHNRWK